MNYLFKYIAISVLFIFFVGCDNQIKKEVQRNIIPSKFAITLSDTVVGERYRQTICARYKQHPEMDAALVRSLLNTEEDIKYIYSVEYDSNFSVDELKQLDFFFRSELGKKYLEAMNKINNRLYSKEKEITIDTRKQQQDLYFRLP